MLSQKPDLPILVEIIGIVILSIGIGIELAYKADIGYITMSVGAAIGSCGAFIYAKVNKRGG